MSDAVMIITTRNTTNYSHWRTLANVKELAIETSVLIRYVSSFFVRLFNDASIPTMICVMLVRPGLLYTL